MAQPFTVALEGGDAVGALAYAAGGPTSAEATVILAHGAGAPQTHQFMTSFAKGLSTRGLDVITFNFLYMERKRRAPGPAARLEACYRAVIDTARQRMKLESQRLVVGGKSMGGRIASQVVAAGTEAGGTTADGLVLLGSPLHPPGRPDKLRDVHLPAITAPMLFVQGSRDTFGTPDELRPVVARCWAAELNVVEGGDHSLKVRGKDALTADETYASVQDAIAAWIAKNLEP